MQRMRLHTQGVKLPVLGSVQDRVFRQFALKESVLEAKRSEFQMLTLLTNPDITEESKFNSWRSTVGKVWKQYVGLLFNSEIEDESKAESELLRYYTQVVKSSRLMMRKDKNSGDLILSGLDTVQL